MHFSNETRNTVDTNFIEQLKIITKVIAAGVKYSKDINFVLKLVDVHASLTQIFLYFWVVLISKSVIKFIWNCIN